ncbi:unannotated protein [freshwater metagenome]|uniref:Unannotated protein n=1 Tax=freshwater metagenome TaxID=449393 RepID=A0A6J5YEN6_9ZZZZ
MPWAARRPRRNRSTPTTMVTTRVIRYSGQASTSMETRRRWAFWDPTQRTPPRTTARTTAAPRIRPPWRPRGRGTGRCTAARSRWANHANPAPMARPMVMQRALITPCMSGDRGSSVGDSDVTPNSRPHQRENGPIGARRRARREIHGCCGSLITAMRGTPRCSSPVVHRSADGQRLGAGRCFLGPSVISLARGRPFHLIDERDRTRHLVASDEVATMGR